MAIRHMALLHFPYWETQTITWCTWGLCTKLMKWGTSVCGYCDRMLWKYLLGCPSGCSFLAALTLLQKSKIYYHSILLIYVYKVCNSVVAVDDYNSQFNPVDLNTMKLFCVSFLTMQRNIPPGFFPTVHLFQNNFTNMFLQWNIELASCSSSMCKSSKFCYVSCDGAS